MTGELIPTGVTFGTGRNSVNDAFSGTAYMNNIELDSGGNFSAGTGGGAIFSAGTDLYNIFVSTADGNDITRVQPGNNTTTGGTGNSPTVNLTPSPSVNNISFSGTAFGVNIQATTGTLTTLTASTVSGGTFYSGGTPLSNIILSLSGTSGNLWSASTGENSIVQSLSLNNIAGGFGAITFGSGNTIASFGPTTHRLNYILGGLNNSFTIPGGYCPPFGCNVLIGGKNNELRSTFHYSENSIIIGGENNILFTKNGAILGGSGNTVSSSDYSISIGGFGNNIATDNSIIIGGSGNYLGSFSLLENITMIACDSISLLGTPYSGIQNNTTVLQRAFVDEYIDFKPLTSYPTAQKGRMFFSGGTFNKMMFCTGYTSSDWTIL